MSSQETEKIKERYERRDGIQSSVSSTYASFFVKEREQLYKEIINQLDIKRSEFRFLEVGAGKGDNIPFFKSVGIAEKQIYANELLENRLDILLSNEPKINHIKGDALKISKDFNASFDLIFQSTVFTSILDDTFKKQLAEKMWSMLKPGGIILWYDFQYNNPKNKDVKGIKKDEIRQLFSQAKDISFKKVTLAPPIGRRVGKAYPLFNAFPFLRTHLIAVIKK